MASADVAGQPEEVPTYSNDTAVPEYRPEDFEVQDGTLSCAGRDLTAIPAFLGEPFGQTTRTLDFSFNILSSIDNLEMFTNLDSLILDNNELGDDAVFPPLPTLKTLSLNNNNFADLDKLLSQLAASTPNIQYLSMLKNPACPNALTGADDEDYNRFRLQVIHTLGNLKFLDSRPVTANEKKEAARVAQFLKVAKPDLEQFEKQRTSKPQTEETPTEYRPLPPDLADHGNHTGTFGVCKYVYYGKHSEGNRFIRNNDL